MKPKSSWVARGVLAACAIAAPLTWGGSASALTNGAPCSSPFWTEVASPFADIELSPPAVSKGEPVHVDGSLSIEGTADMWTFVSIDNACEATRTVHDPIGLYTWTFGDGSPQETHAAPIATATHSYSKPGTYTITLTVTEQNCAAGASAHCFTGKRRLGSTFEAIRPSPRSTRRQASRSDSLRTSMRRRRPIPTSSSPDTTGISGTARAKMRPVGPRLTRMAEAGRRPSP